MNYLLIFDLPKQKVSLAGNDLDDDECYYHSFTHFVCQQQKRPKTNGRYEEKFTRNDNF